MAPSAVRSHRRGVVAVRAALVCIAGVAAAIAVHAGERGDGVAFDAPEGSPEDLERSLGIRDPQSSEELESRDARALFPRRRGEATP